MRCHTAAGAGLACLAAAHAAAQSTAPIETAEVPFAVDSGFVQNLAAERGTVFATIVRVPGASWIKLTLDEATLGEAPAGGQPTVLRITSLMDGAAQHHTTLTLQQWRNASAVFNGDAVQMELIADPDAGRSRIVMSQLLIGPPAGGGIASICGPTDDRQPSSDPRAARTFPGGCTSWMISDFSNCFLTAGHCVSPGLTEVHFNIPLSDSNGSVNFPPPEDQYAVDPASLQWVSGGVGNDWCYFGTFRNTETGLTAFEAQGAAFDLAATPPPVAGQSIRITGYGVDDSPLTWNQIQQTHVGPYATFVGSTVQYQTDTQGGNSGSPVINEQTGEAIGVHTHGGCSAGGGVNSGTGINNGGLQAALEDPQGICVPAPPLDFAFPNGLPELIDPAGGVIAVEVLGANGGEPQPGTGMLHYDAGAGFVAVPMQEVTPNLYDAVFPVLECGTMVSYYFSADSTGGNTVNNPLLAPEETYSVLATPSLDVVFQDDFEADLGWTVANVGGLTDGAWERGTPIPHSICDRGNPNSDADGSGQCFLTDNDPLTCNSDVDGGSTILTSPVMNATQGAPFINYWRWFDNTGAGTGPNQFEDTLVVEVSDDGGGSWQTLETVGPTGPEVEGGWFLKSFSVVEFVDLTDQFRIRFIASDTGGGSIVEAAVDLVELSSLGCAECPWDCAEPSDGVVGIADFLALLAQWGGVGTSCDLGAPGVDISDFLDLLANWGECG